MKREPWKDRHHVNLVIHHDLVEKIKELAESQHRSLTAQIIYLLERALENEPTQSPR